MSSASAHTLQKHTVLCYTLNTQLFVKPQYIPHMDPGCDPLTHSWPGCCVWEGGWERLLAVASNNPEILSS